MVAGWHHRQRTALIVLALTILLLPALAAAQQPLRTPIEDDGMRVERTPEEARRLSLKLQTEFMSPYCPGMNLRDCTSGKAEILREQVRVWLEEGRTVEWIRRQMVAEFGESILGAPLFKGFNRLVWIAPILALLLGGALVAHFLGRQSKLQLTRKTTHPEPDPDFQPDPEIERRLQQEIDARSV